MTERAKNIMHLIHSSEMICSLRFEDMRGCPYNSFSTQDIAVLASLCSALSIVTLLFGA